MEIRRRQGKDLNALAQKAFSYSPWQTTIAKCARAKTYFKQIPFARSFSLSLSRWYLCAGRHYVHCLAGPNSSLAFFLFTSSSALSILFAVHIYIYTTILLSARVCGGSYAIPIRIEHKLRARIVHTRATRYIVPARSWTCTTSSSSGGKNFESNLERLMLWGKCYINTKHQYIALFLMYSAVVCIIIHYTAATPPGKEMFMVNF